MRIIWEVGLRIQSLAIDSKSEELSTTPFQMYFMGVNEVNIENLAGRINHPLFLLLLEKRMGRENQDAKDSSLFTYHQRTLFLQLFNSFLFEIEGLEWFLYVIFFLASGMGTICSLHTPAGSIGTGYGTYVLRRELS